MVSLFKSLFSTAQRNHANTTQLIVKPAKIIIWLKKFVAHKNVLTAKIPGAAQTYSTAVLSIDKSQQCFRVDELSPAGGHTALLQAGRLYFSTQHQGASLLFHAKLLAKKNSPDNSYYELKLPESIKYQQRRTYYRVQIEQKSLLLVNAYHAGSNVRLSGFVSDISIQGMGLIFDQGLQMKRGDVLQHVHFSFPDGSSVRCNLTVRHVQTLSAGRMRVGGRFCKLNRDNQSRIEKWVRKLERQQLKKNNDR